MLVEGVLDVVGGTGTESMTLAARRLVYMKEAHFADIGIKTMNRRCFRTTDRVRAIDS